MCDGSELSKELGWADIPLECRRYLLRFLPFKNIIRLSIINKRYLKGTARNVITSVDCSEFSFSTAAHAIGRMKSLEQLVISSYNSYRISTRLDYLIRQNEKLTKLSLQCPEPWSAVERLIPHLPRHLKSLNLELKRPTSDVESSLISLLEKLRETVDGLEELRISIEVVKDLGLSCFVPLQTFPKLRQATLIPTTASIVSKLPQLLASKITFQTSTLFVEELKKKPFDIERARYLIAQGSNPNILLPVGTRPILYCATVESMRFMFEETSFDPSLPLAQGVSIAAAACIVLTPEVLEYFLLGPHIEKYSKHGPFADLKVLPRDFMRFVNMKHHLRENVTSLLRSGNYAVLLKPEVINMYGSIIDAVSDETGDSLLHLAARTAASSDFSLLISAGARTNALNNDKCIPLQLLISNVAIEHADMVLDATQDPIDFFAPLPIDVTWMYAAKLSLFQYSVFSKRWSIVRAALERGNPSSNVLTRQLCFEFPTSDRRGSSILRLLIQDFREGLDIFMSIIRRRQLNYQSIPSAPIVATSLIWAAYTSHKLHYLPEAIALGLPASPVTLITQMAIFDEATFLSCLETYDSFFSHGESSISVAPVLKSVAIGYGRFKELKRCLELFLNPLASGAPLIDGILGSSNFTDCPLRYLILNQHRAVESDDKVSVFFSCADLLVDLLQKYCTEQFDWNALVSLIDRMEQGPVKRDPRCDALRNRIVNSVQKQDTST